MQLNEHVANFNQNPAVMNQNQLLTPDHLHLSAIKFKREDALSNLFDKKERLDRLVSAMKLGNLHKQKVRIKFMNSQDHVMEVKAKVWSVTEKYVILRNSISIPISSIVFVNFH